ncbi:MAG: DUF3592 domain-containing protein [Pirellulaceae bacterium]|nr:DUF3592 domain-containing protein [Pirellulaceae bacterium]
MVRRSNSLIGQIIVTIIAVGVGGLFTFYLGLPMYFRAKASTEWPTVPGRIQVSEVKQTTEKGKTKYSASLQFSYDVKGKNYESAYIWPSGGYSSNSKTNHRAIVERYPVGKEVKVYYDPREPSFGVLEPGLTATNYIVLIAGALFFLAGLVLGLYTLRRIMGLAWTIGSGY